MVQQCAPLPVLHRLAKTHGMGFQRLPLHQQQIAPRYFQAALQGVTGVTGGDGNQRRSLGKSLLERVCPSLTCR